MALEENLNKILKEMWRLDEKISVSDILTDSEKTFYYNNLQTIKDYYEKNNMYWKNKNIIMYENN